jgi:transcriptional regulator with XRE-family HTH domain
MLLRTASEEAPDHRDQVRSVALGAFLKSLRMRIHCEVRALGSYERLPCRRGRRVTQEEASEAVGVSRVWYATLESGATVRTSTRVLSRLADVLMLGAEERIRLFQLAIPEFERLAMPEPAPGAWPASAGVHEALLRSAVPALETTTLRADSKDMLDAFAWMRAAAKRLWSATTEIEALTIATEAVADRFRDAPITQNLVRAADGSWPVLLMLGDSRLIPRATECIERLNEELGPAGMDELRCYPHLSQPGDTYTEEAWTSKSIRDQLFPVLAEYGFDSWSFLCGRVRSRSGWIAGIHVRRRMKKFSPEEKAALSSLTELTSLALV